MIFGTYEQMVEKLKTANPFITIPYDDFLIIYVRTRLGNYVCCEILRNRIGVYKVFREHPDYSRNYDFERVKNKSWYMTRYFDALIMENLL